jgi:hypothetical protein
MQLDGLDGAFNWCGNLTMIFAKNGLGAERAASAFCPITSGRPTAGLHGKTTAERLSDASKQKKPAPRQSRGVSTDSGHPGST